MSHDKSLPMPLQIEAVNGAIEQITDIHAQNPTLDPAAMVLRLRKTSPALDKEVLSLAVETFFARLRATEKLGIWAEKGFFSTALLEQATREPISRYRARFFDGLQHVLEIGTGTGADTAALARVAAHVTTVEKDPVRARLAVENLQLQGISNYSIVVGEVEQVLMDLDLSLFDGLYADPARRDQHGTRVKSASDYFPSLDYLLELTVGKVRAIKVSPGLFIDPPTPEWKRLFLGTGNECLEQTLLYGTNTSDSSIYLADIECGWTPAYRYSPLPSPDAIRGYISEAHALVNRSQRLSYFFAEHAISQLAPDIAYGVSEHPPQQTPLLDSFRILNVLPYSLPKLKRTLHAHGWTNRTELKKRNSSVNLESLRRALGLPAHNHTRTFGTVFIVTWKGRQLAILTERLHGE